jgi:hypothetical protein
MIAYFHMATKIVSGHTRATCLITQYMTTSTCDQKSSQSVFLNWVYVVGGMVGLQKQRTAIIEATVRIRISFCID